MGKLKDYKIKIIINGNKKFRQKVMDEIYKVLIDDELFEDVAKKGNGFRLISDIEPSEEIY